MRRCWRAVGSLPKLPGGLWGLRKRSHPAHGRCQKVPSARQRHSSCLQLWAAPPSSTVRRPALAWLLPGPQLESEAPSQGPAPFGWESATKTGRDRGRRHGGEGFSTLGC